MSAPLCCKWGYPARVHTSTIAGGHVYKSHPACGCPNAARIGRLRRRRFGIRPLCGATRSLPAMAVVATGAPPSDGIATSRRVTWPHNECVAKEWPRMTLDIAVTCFSMTQMNLAGRFNCMEETVYKRTYKWLSSIYWWESSALSPVQRRNSSNSINSHSKRGTHSVLANTSILQRCRNRNQLSTIHRDIHALRAQAQADYVRPTHLQRHKHNYVCKIQHA
jgi:hypothetical protein